jgi:hypothetical protein
MRSISLLLLMVVIACVQSPEPAVLRDPDPAVCRFTTAFIRLEDRQVDYRLNGSAGYDSTAIARFPRPTSSSGRIRLASS